MDTDKNIPRNYKCAVRLEHRIFWPALFTIAAVIGISMHVGINWYWVVVICLPFLLAGVAVLWWPVIEPANGVVRERVLLFGQKVLAERITPFNEFVEIFYEWGEGSGNGLGNYCLGLRHKSGRKFWVEGSWAIPRTVEETAWQISCDTGIRLKGEPVPK